jgi:hypothetical protein
MTKRSAGWLGASAMTALLFLTTSGIARAEDWMGNINLQFGKRAMDQADDWDPVTHNISYGVEATWGKQDQPLMFATDIYYSHDDETRNVLLGAPPPVSAQTNTKVKAYELAIGLRKVWVAGILRPYAGAGVSLLQTDLEVIEPSVDLANTLSFTTRSGHDRTTGLWVGGGLGIRPLPNFHIGVYARYTPSNFVRPLGVNLDGSSGMAGVNVGWVWGDKPKS